ncbi:Bacterial Transmembrane Pair family protein [Pigmentiphaga humi]|uniref:Bacterial Transmembrane Pair family protein n=1 Tax=Pigmentiphaga humi TaxID=2478468 RepID=A0A3P4AXY7_9BURK|nr:multidrug/biocide efflux PACE transporter [Pigmentiphaga humi]VCU68939.1 Bacterial Transmembrane Pair family protein [Pigmentiphaga humi]
MVPEKKLWERVLYAVCYEFIALVLCAPALAWAMDKPLAQMGALTLAISLIAMAWNMVYNAGFERLERRYGWQRTPPMRMAHAFGFEGGLVLLVVPFVAWWLHISLWEALVLDIGLLLFFLPYTYVYNLAYDRIRARWIAARRRGACPE